MFATKLIFEKTFLLLTSPNLLMLTCLPVSLRTTLKNSSTADLSIKERAIKIIASIIFSRSSGEINLISFAHSRACEQYFKTKGSVCRLKLLLSSRNDKRLTGLVNPRASIAICFVRGFSL